MDRMEDGKPNGYKLNKKKDSKSVSVKSPKDV